MSSFHGQTRPDTPRIPQDLATKAYVDGVQGDFFFMGTNVSDAVAPTVAEYCGYFGGKTFNFSGVARSTILPNAVKLDRLFVDNRLNTADDETICSVFNITTDTVTIVTLTIPTLVTGIFSDIVNSVEFASGIIVSFEADATAVGTGSCNITSFMVRAEML